MSKKTSITLDAFQIRLAGLCFHFIIILVWVDDLLWAFVALMVASQFLFLLFQVSVNNDIELKNLPVHHQAPFTPNSLHFQFWVRLELKCKVTKNAIITQLERVCKGNSPFSNKRTVNTFHGREETSYLWRINDLLWAEIVFLFEHYSVCLLKKNKNADRYDQVDACSEYLD